jgi:prevent-host-death family protein
MEVNIHHAKTHLSKLIQQAEDGEEVIIARAGEPAVKLVPVAKEKGKRRHILGSAVGKIWISDDFESPEANREIEDLFNGDDEKFTG